MKTAADRDFFRTLFAIAFAEVLRRAKEDEALAAPVLAERAVGLTKDAVLAEAEVFAVEAEPPTLFKAGGVVFTCSVCGRALEREGESIKGCPDHPRGPYQLKPHLRTWGEDFAQLRREIDALTEESLCECGHSLGRHAIVSPHKCAEGNCTCSAYHAPPESGGGDAH